MAKRRGDTLSYEQKVDALTHAVLDVLRAPSPDHKSALFATKTAALKRARKYALSASTLSGLPKGIWDDVTRRFRLVYDPEEHKALRVKEAFHIRHIRVARSEQEIPDEAARLHIAEIDLEPNEEITCFYSCGKTLAETVRRAASFGRYGGNLTVCSSVVLATDAPSALPPGAITAEFLREGSQVKTLSYLLPRALQENLKIDDNAETRRIFRNTIDAAVFAQAAKASFLWLGIGAIEQAGSFTEHCRTIGAIKALKDAGAVAEVGFMPVNREGRLIFDDLGLARTAKGSRENWRKLAPELRRFFNSTYVLKLESLPREVDVIVVAGGRLKREAIWHGLRFLSRSRTDTGIGQIAYLVTDVETLDYLYDQLLQSEPKPTDRSSTVPPPLPLPADLVDALGKLASERNTSVEAVLRQALEQLGAGERGRAARRPSTPPASERGG